MKEQVVITPFLFSDLIGSKRRPSLMIADWNADDIILTAGKISKDKCQSVAEQIFKLRMLQ